GCFCARFSATFRAWPTAWSMISRAAPSRFMAADRIAVEVAAALPERQLIVALEVPAGTTLAEAVEQADLPARLPGLVVDCQRLGIFGKRRDPDTVLAPGDRVEIYRPLTADPKEIRRQLAELARGGRNI